MTSNRPSSAHSYHHQASASPTLPTHLPHPSQHHYQGGHLHPQQYIASPMADYRHNADQNRHGAIPPHTGTSHHHPSHPHAPQSHHNGPPGNAAPRERDHEYERFHSSGNGGMPGRSTPKGAGGGPGAGGYWRPQDGPHHPSSHGHTRPPTSEAPLYPAAAEPNGYAGHHAHTAPVATPPPASLGSGIKLNFKRPAATQDVERFEDSDAEAKEGRARETDSPGSVGGSGKKRRRVLEVAPNPGRSSRSRNSTPPVLHIHAPIPHTSGNTRSNTSTPGPTAPPAQRTSGAGAGTTSAPTNLPASLHIFAPPPDPSLPQALQDILPSSSAARPAASSSRQTATSAATTGRPDASADTLLREAGEGFENRRSGRARQPVLPPENLRAGVNATGKGVKVGNLPKDDKDGKVPRKKGKRNADVPNQDFCSACRGVGKFLCCDGCPRSFHFMCLEPPLQVDELPEEETWYCKECSVERVGVAYELEGRISDEQAPKRQPSPQREPKPIPTVFKQLTRRIEEENPATFKLPLDIRQFFNGIATDSRGNYVDQEETRTKYDRRGFQEERDGTRLRDAKARPVSCYVCGGSSMPLRSHTTDPESTWRQIVSCDYCALHWHLDCLSPPLASMPNAGRKWMCPNHAEQVMNRKRTVRGGVETVDIDHRGMRNNGNITVVPDPEARELMDYEDMIINKKKYRVPEKIIRLDFWDKLGLTKRGKKVAPAKGGDGVFKRRSASSDGSDAVSEADSDEGEEEEDELMSIDVIEPSPADIDAANLVLSLLRATPSVDTPSRSGQSAMSVGTSTTLQQAQQGASRSNTPRSGTPASAAGDAASTGNGSAGGGTPRIMLKMSRPAQ